MIVITTPGGQIGHHVLEHCLRRNESVRVIARDASKLPSNVRGRIDVVEGSHGDPAVIDRALNGAHALFWLIPPQPHSESIEDDYIQFTQPAADAIKRHGIAHVVDVKAIAAGTRWAESAGLATISERMDAVIAATGVNLRSLAAPSLMDNVLMQLEPILERGILSGPIDADRKMPQIAARDIGTIAAGLLSDRGWSGQETRALLGPENYSFNDMAAIVGDVLGKPVFYREISFDAFAAQQREQRMPATYVDAMVEMMKAKDEGLDEAPERTVESTTATTFRDWCEQLLKAANNSFSVDKHRQAYAERYSFST